MTDAKPKVEKKHVDEQYFVVNRTPEDWIKLHPQAAGVVKSDVWQRGRFWIGNLPIVGRGAWRSYHPVWAYEVVYYNTERTSLSTTLNTIVVHHTDNNFSVHTNEVRQIGSRERYAALAYHFYIDPKGVIYEGRPLEVMGSHAGSIKGSGVLGDPDWGKIGIVLQGDYHYVDDRFTHDEVPQVQVDAAERLIRELMKIYAIQAMELHREVRRDGQPKECPGDQLVPVFEKMRARLGLRKP